MREFMSHIGAMSPEGHTSFMKYIETFDRHQAWSDTKENMSEAMKSFLRIAEKSNGEDE